MHTTFTQQYSLVKRYSVIQVKVQRTKLQDCDLKHSDLCKAPHSEIHPSIQKFKKKNKKNFSVHGKPQPSKNNMTAHLKTICTIQTAIERMYSGWKKLIWPEITLKDVAYMLTNSILAVVVYLNTQENIHKQQILTQNAPEQHIIEVCL